MIAVPIAVLLLIQDPPARPQERPPASAPVATPAPVPVASWTDAEAKSAIESFGKALKADGSMAARSKALELLAGGSHKLLVKPLAQTIETDKSIVIRKRAAGILGQQPAADANPVILKLIRNPRVASQPAVVADLVRALAGCGYQTAQWKEIADLFERDYAADNVGLQEAVLGLVERHKEKQAIDLLLRNMDEPAPADVDDANNPPAEYWEARWKAWKAWRVKVKDAMFAITGQRFSTASEAKAWLRKNPIK